MSRKMPIRLVIADDHPMIVEFISQMLGVRSDFRILATAANGEETIRAVCEHEPDILILDIQMPDKDGFKVLQELKEKGLTCRTIIHAAVMDESRYLEAITLGVQGVLLKSMPISFLETCIRKVHEGEQWLEKSTVSRVFEELLKRGSSISHKVNSLTAKELEVVKAVAIGLNTEAIARKLNIKTGTVRVHLRSIYEKLEVNDRVELALFAQKNVLF